MNTITLSCILALGTVAGNVRAAEPTLPTVDISAEVSRSAPNDQFRAQVFAEAADANPGELARRINTLIAQALHAAKAYPAIKVRSAGNATYPIYAKTGRSIESWRMRSSLALEAQDSAQLSELLGKLQQTLAVGALEAAPSPETWKRVEDQAIAEAIGAFEARANLVAGSLHRKWKIKHMSVNTGGQQPRPVMAMARSAAMMSDAAPPPPIQAGDSPVSVSINGQIELLE